MCGSNREERHTEVTGETEMYDFFGLRASLRYEVAEDAWKISELLVVVSDRVLMSG